MWAPFVAYANEISAKRWMLASLSMWLFVSKMPQWPWLVYGHKQTSVAITKSGKCLRSNGNARTTGFSAESAELPRLSYIKHGRSFSHWNWMKFSLMKILRMWISNLTFGKLSMTPNSKTHFRPLLTSGSKCAITWFTPNRDTPGMLEISSIASSCSLLLKKEYSIQDIQLIKKQTEQTDNALTLKIVDTSNFPVRC